MVELVRVKVNGGARLGGGRKPGKGITKVTIRKALAMAEELGLYPIQVMLLQMNDAHNRSLEYRKKLADLIEDDEDDEGAKKFEKTLNRMIKFFDIANSRAVCAAQYVHPKLNSLAFNDNDSAPGQIKEALIELVDLLEGKARAKSALIDVTPEKVQ